VKEKGRKNKNKIKNMAIVAELFNRSLDAGHFPAAFKEASVTPIVKKPSSYRPISNLSVLSDSRTPGGTTAA